MDAGTIGAALTGAVALLKDETPSPQLDAEMLLGHVLKRPRSHLIAHREESVPGKTLRAYTSFVRRRAAGIPLPYLTGTTEFYGRPFIVTPAVMVPRPESEAIVDEVLHLLDTAYHERHPDEGSRRDSSSPELALERSEGAPQNDRRGLIVADIGTGSGVLAVTIAAEAARVRVVATDKSSSALVIARRNARRHKVANRMTFIESDLLTEIPPELAPSIIVANLPYVPSDDLKHPTSPRLRRAGADFLETRGLKWEPKVALDGGPDGLFVIRRFFAQLKRGKLKDQLHHLILEHGPTQHRRILELVHDALPTFRPHEVTPFVTRWTQESW